MFSTMSSDSSSESSTFSSDHENHDNQEFQRRFNRRQNQRRNRAGVWEFVGSWSEKLFKRQFRMSRKLFMNLLQKMIASYPGRYIDGWRNYQYSQQQGKNSYGDPIKLEIKLCITLRMLAGASYLDMIWYGVSVNSVDRIFLSLGCLLEAWQ